MQQLQQLFVHELQDAYAAEQRLVQALQRMTQCQSDQQVQQVFRTHLAETQAHLDRIQQVFSMLGLQPGTEPCPGMDGIVQEHEQFLQVHQPAPQMHAMFDVGSGQRAEHYEIATYEELISLANLLGMDQAVQLFESTLADERRQLSRLQDIASEMGQQLAQQEAQTMQQQTQPAAQGQQMQGTNQQGQATASPQYQSSTR